MGSRTVIRTSSSKFGIQGIAVAIVRRAGVVRSPKTARLQGGPGAGPRQPPTEARAACAKLSSGSPCRFTSPRGDAISGSCRSPGGALLKMDFPARPGKPVAVTDALDAALGARPREAYMARDLLAIFDSDSDVRSLRPDFPRIASLAAFAVIVSAPGDTVDFVSRFFAPGAGIPEDPATGSSHCTLVPYWAARLGKNKLVAKQLSARGGDLLCELSGDRVVIAGQVVEYLRGEIETVGPAI